MIASIIIAFSSSAATPPSKSQGANTPDAIYRLIRHSYTLNQDGTMDYNYRKEVAILRNRALTAYAWMGETFITYNPAFETLKINECYTLQKDGTKVETPKAGFIEQLPSNSTDCGRYNGIRELAIVHTGMEIGCTVVLDYTIHRNSDKIFANFTLAEDCPVDRYEVILQNTGKAKLEWGENCVTKKDFTCENLGTRCVWIATNLPQKYSDPYLPADSQLYNSIYIHSGHRCNWFVFNNDEMLPDAKMLIATLGETDRVAHAINIANYVVNNVATNDIAPELLNFVISPAATTWQSNCGTPSDKTQLLGALLREGGYNATALVEHGTMSVKLTVEGKEYKLSAIKKNELSDEKAMPVEETTPTAKPLDWRKKDLGKGYTEWTMPQPKMGFDARYLTDSRKAPLNLKKTETTEAIYNLTQTKGKMTTKPYDIRMNSKTKTKDGKPLWTMHIKLQQTDTTINATRSFVINDDYLISGKEYKAFREALIKWQSSTTLIVTE